MDIIKNKPWIYTFQDLLKETLNTLPDEFTLAFSGGIDSSMLLFQLLEMNKQPTELITFQIDDWESNDLIFTKKIASELNIPLTVVNIPIISKDSGTLIVKDIIDIIGNSRKIDIQCCYAFDYMLKEMKTKHLLTGLYEDVIYEVNEYLKTQYTYSKQGKITEDELNEEYFKHKRLCYEDKNFSGTEHNHASIRKLVEHYGYTLHTPLRYKKIYELFQTVGYVETNYIQEGDKTLLRKKWFVTDVLYKDWFERFGNGKNNSNMHKNKDGLDLHTLHHLIFTPKRYKVSEREVIKVYNQIAKYNNNKQHNFF